MPDTPLFVKTHDFNVWLFQHTQRFPKHLRHTYTNRLESLALDFEEALLMANAARGQVRSRWLERADGRIVRMFCPMPGLHRQGARQARPSECQEDDTVRILSSAPLTTAGKRLP